MKKKCTFYTLSLIIILNSCTNSIEENLNSVEKYIDQYPDSALVTLDSLQYEIGISSDDSNKLNLLTIIAKNKLGKDIAEDTTIFNVVRYYTEKRNNPRLTQALLYAGRVYEENEENEKSMRCYLDAEELAKKLPNQERLNGLIQSSIGDLYFKEFYVENAISRYHNSLKYFESIHDYANITAICNSLGICHAFAENKKDSAIYYFDKGFMIAKSINDKALMMACKQNIALVFLHEKNTNKSIEYFNEALIYSNNPVDSINIYFNIGRAYFMQNKIDSAQLYVNKIYIYNRDDIHYSLSNNIISLQSNILKREHKYKEALELYDEFVNYIDSEYAKFKDTNILEIKNKYKLEIIQNKHNKILISRQKIIIGLLLILLTSIVLGLLITIKSLINKKALAEANERISEFLEVVENYNSENDSLKAIVLDHFEILKKAALIDNLVKKNDKNNGEKILAKFNQIIYGQNKLDWDVLYNTMNKVYNGQLDLVRNTFTQLEEQEFKICCLVYSKFSRTEISILLGISSSTISSRNSSIRKKMGIDEYGNIAEHINNLRK